jgi:hypothetical protein
MAGGAEMQGDQGAIKEPGSLHSRPPEMGTRRQKSLPSTAQEIEGGKTVKIGKPRNYL